MKAIYTTILFFTIIGGLKSQEIVRIGSQNWTKENLSVSKFRNGDVIPEAKTKEEWIQAYIEKKPVWCYYENSTENGKNYGKLYNYYAVQDLRGLAPNGFHIPTENEWNILIETLEGKEKAGTLLKTENDWCNSGNGNNKSKFYGKPGGFRIDSGDFINIGCGGYWWTFGKTVFMLNWSTNSIEKNNGLSGGYSIRCIKD